MRKALLLLLTLLLCGALVALLSRNQAERRQDEAVDRIVAQKPVVMPATPATPVAPDAQNDSWPLMDFSQLKQSNAEIVAWLTLDNTTIDYPITQAPDNDTYLHIDAYGKKNKNGSAFLDYRLHADFSDPNNIVYGHNMESGKMFADINLFKDENYFHSHTSGWLYTPDKTYRLQLFEVAVVPSIGNAYTWSFEASSAWDAYLTQLSQDAKHKRDIDLQWGDRLLTLSTCSYEFKNARTILIAKLIG